jgi:hypothetical protein
VRLDGTDCHHRPARARPRRHRVHQPDAAQVLAGDFHGDQWSLHDLAGTQFSWLVPATQPMTVTLTSMVDWVTLHDAAVVDARVRAAAATTSITLTVSDADPFASQLPVTGSRSARPRRR